MVDFSLCTNDECELRSKCHRSTATPSEYQQSYTKYQPTKLTELMGLKVKQEIFCNYFKPIP